MSKNKDAPGIVRMSGNAGKPDSVEIKDSVVKVILVYKDHQEDVFAKAYGTKVIEISTANLEKYGKVVDSANPDIVGILMLNVQKAINDIINP